MPKSVAFLLLIAGGVGLFFSIREVLWESRIVRGFVPVSAQITLASIPGLADGRMQTYFPTIKYHYEVGGQTYESSRIWPYVGTVYKTQAQDLARRFPTGSTATAYVDPQNPAEAVLVRDYSSWPYWPVAASLIIAAIGGGRLVRLIQPKRKTMQAKIANDFGWQLLLPSKQFTERLYEALFLVAAIGLPLLFMAWHLAARVISISTFVIAFIVLAMAVFGVLALWAGRAWRLTRRVSNLRLIVNSAPMRLGKPFAFRVEANVLARIQFSEMRARVVCIKRNLLHHGRRTHLQKTVLGQRVLRLAGKSALPKGDMLKGASETVFAPENWPPSGSEGMTRYPYITWEVRIEVVGPTQFTVIFPLEVVNSDLARSSTTTARQKA